MGEKSIDKCIEFFYKNDFESRKYRAIFQYIQGEMERMENNWITLEEFGRNVKDFYLKIEKY